MNLDQVSALLALIAQFDNRKADSDTAYAWHTILADVDFNHAAQAVREHFATSEDYLRPVHITARAAELRKAAWEERERAIAAGREKAGVQKPPWFDEAVAAAAAASRAARAAGYCCRDKPLLDSAEAAAVAVAQEWEMAHAGDAR